jgi:hypothetical protein
MLLALWAAAAAFVVWGAPGVPFHPDESTYLYMSQDFDRLIHQGPASVTWQSANQPGDVLRYRLLDAPMIHYLVGLGRSLAGLPALPRDWSWSMNWVENGHLGAMPSPAQLTAARLPVALMTPCRWDWSIASVRGEWSGHRTIGRTAVRLKRRCAPSRPPSDGRGLLGLLRSADNLVTPE